METVHTTSEPAGGQVVAFTLGGEEYSLPIDQIREVIRYTPPRPITSPDPYMLGVLSLRGQIVPITNLAARLEVNAQHDETSKIVIIETAEHDTAGVIVDDVKEVLTIHQDQIEPLPTKGSIAKIDDRLLVMLEVSDIIDPASADQTDEPAG